MNEGKTPAPKGVYICEFRSASLSIRSNHVGHKVLLVRIAPTGCGIDRNDVCEYSAALPLVLTVGGEFGFYNKATNKSVVRKVTSADAKEAWEYARKCFPEWATYCDTDAESLHDALAWFDADHPETTVRAAIKEPREYDGNLYYEANIYEFRSQNRHAVADEIDDAVVKSMMAAGIKFGGKKAAKPAPAAKPISKPLPAAKPAKPATPEKPPVDRVFTSDDAWAAYEHGEWIRKDPQGEKFYESCATIVGTDASAYDTWTSDDWKKCTETFALPF